MAILLLTVTMLALAVGLLDNPEMRRRGITCARDEEFYK